MRRVNTISTRELPAVPEILRTASMYSTAYTRAPEHARLLVCLNATGKSITLIRRHKPHTATATALYVTDRAGVQLRPLSMSVTTDFDLQPYSDTLP